MKLVKVDRSDIRRSKFRIYDILTEFARMDAEVVEIVDPPEYSGGLNSMRSTWATAIK